jgi:hypothetical protein
MFSNILIGCCLLLLLQVRVAAAIVGAGAVVVGGVLGVGVAIAIAGAVVEKSPKTVEVDLLLSGYHHYKKHYKSPRVYSTGYCRHAARWLRVLLATWPYAA